MTNAQLIELIINDYSAGMQHDDSELTPEEVSLWLKPALATAIEQKYKQDAEIESITYMNDAYYATFKNRTVSRDSDTGYYYFTLPQIPLGLPKGVSIAGVYFKSSEGQLTETVIQIAPQEIDVMNGLVAPKNKIYGWAEKSTFYMKSYKVLTSLNAIVRMVTSSPISDTDEIPDNIALAAADIVIRRIRTRNIPQDISNDGVDQK